MEGWRPKRSYMYNVHVCGIIASKEGVPRNEATGSCLLNFLSGLADTHEHNICTCTCTLPLGSNWQL